MKPIKQEEPTAETAEAKSATNEPYRLSARELNEIKLAMFYHAECNHGTAGHNRLNLIAKLAFANGLTSNSVNDLIDLRERAIAKAEENGLTRVE